jgi:hypothetical protein
MEYFSEGLFNLEGFFLNLDPLLDTVYPKELITHYPLPIPQLRLK